MKHAKAISAVAICVALPLSAGAAVPAAEGTALSARYNCSACHAQDKKVVGPSYQEVAKKYSGDASAAAKLAAKVKAGGSGVWGSMPMPPNNVPDADLKKLIDWILAAG